MVGQHRRGGWLGLKEYVLQRDSTQIAIVTGTSYTETALTAGTTYSYRVAARDNAGNTSAFSAAIQAATLAPPDTTAPSVPTGLASSGSTQVSIVLLWTASTDNVGGSGLKEYVLQRNAVQIAVLATPGYTDTGLAAGTSYSYRVAARDNAGNTSAFSGTLQASTPWRQTPRTVDPTGAMSWATPPAARPCR